MEETLRGDGSLFQKLGMLTIRGVAERLGHSDYYAAEYVELNDFVEQIQQRRNYGAGVRTRPQGAILPENELARNELRGMLLGHLGCVEKDGGTLKRENKSREIEKVFREKKLRLALMSNKQAMRVTESQAHLNWLAYIAFLTVGVFVAGPFAIFWEVYGTASTTLDECWNVAQYISVLSRFGAEYAEACNSMLLVAHLEAYSDPLIGYM